MATNERDHQDEPDRQERDRPIVTKVSAKDLDQAIRRLSDVTAPYFRSGGPLMPDKSS